jgi:NADH dehydrogenase
MLPELSTGTIEPRHIATPIRNFCKRARFYQAKVTSVDLEKNFVTIHNASGQNQLDYDYLVIAAGTKTGFFGNENLKKYSVTIKSLQDASIIRNQIITQLELADQQKISKQAQFLSFVIVGGGFSGVETSGEINEFILESAEKYYRNIEPDSIQVVLIAARDHILPEIGTLGKYAAKSLEKSGVKIIYNTKVTDASSSQISLNDASSLHYSMLIWAGGNESQDFVSSLDIEHDKSGRIIVDQYLRIQKYPNVFALGDCAYILDSKNKPYPPTAQHAIREAKTTSNNLISLVRGNSKLSVFDYSSKGSMAKIGKRDGVAKMFGINLTGFAAWFVWKQYYLSTLPVMEKRIRVGLDWFIDLFFPRDITKLN